MTREKKNRRKRNILRNNVPRAKHFDIDKQFFPRKDSNPWWLKHLEA